MKIRKMKQSDISEVAKIWSNAFPKQFSPNIRESKKLIRDTLRRNSNFCFIAVENKKVIGFIVGSKFDGDIALLGPIAVNEQCRGRDIGAKLVKKFEKTLKRMGYSTIILTTRYMGRSKEKRKYEASLFYEKLKFKEIARSKEKRVYFKWI